MGKVYLKYIHSDIQQNRCPCAFRSSNLQHGICSYLFLRAANSTSFSPRVRAKPNHFSSLQEARYLHAKLPRMKCAEGRETAWGARTHHPEATYQGYQENKKVERILPVWNSCPLSELLAFDAVEITGFLKMTVLVYTTPGIMQEVQHLRRHLSDSVYG